jgi:hypothetical protein
MFPMYTLIRSLTWLRFATEQLPALFVSIVLAESFYRFHSFVLECGAFLLTWFLLDGLIQWGRRQLVTKK